MTTTIEQELAGLKERRPAGFDERVLSRTLQAAESYVLVEGPIGPLFVVFSERGISYVARAADFALDGAAFARAYEERSGRKLTPGFRPPSRLASALRSGRPTGLCFDLSRCSAFERAVLEKALEIPPGEIRPYGWIAREIGRPRAVRAVGTALGRNPVPVLIPCHRVVRSDGTIGSYALGSAAKRALLSYERVDLELVGELAHRGVRFVATRDGMVFCHPTCRHARRIGATRRVEFKSAAAAVGAGYRPCTACRPDALFTTTRTRAPRNALPSARRGTRARSTR